MEKEEIFEDLWTKLEEFEASSPYDTSEIETTRDAFATALGNLITDSRGEPKSLAEAIKRIPISKDGKSELLELLRDLDDILEAASYDSDDEEQEDNIAQLKTDLYYVFERELKKLETR